ncbi:baseplate assembly protein [Marinobacterium litorale]|jgi:phage-related baseplate assembly protein|uniref:baseplate assembly protein n=1 Tax=Marinobacterium litorale TaxID=404770 RepID=UPI000410D97D|nr:baseplate J/gp47 family protein [Marinobacterium litorale]
MTGFSAIDLARLPSPEVVESLDYEAILAAMLEDLRSRAPGFSALVESDPVYKILEVAAYRELLLRARINDASRAVMLAYARGADLDNLAAFFGVERQLIDPGDAEAIPPVPPRYESDDRLRKRVQLSLEGHSTAGPVGSYVFHSLAASPRVKDVDVTSPEPGKVVVTVLSTEGIGMPDDALLAAVAQRLGAESVRPLTDQVRVQKPRILKYRVEAELRLYEGPDAEVVRQAAEAAARDYVARHHLLGNDITLSGLYAALHQPGVQRVVLQQPTRDLVIAPQEAAWCTQVSVQTGGRDE